MISRQYAELLQKRYPKNNEGFMEATERNLKLAIDMGSTQCRTNALLKGGSDPEESGIIEMDSIYGIVNSDISGYSSNSSAVIDNLELEIKSLTEGTFIKEEHVIFGSLRGSISLTSSHLSSSSAKLNQKDTYINIISNIGIMTLLDNLANKQYARETRISLQMSLPPEDAGNVKRRQDAEAYLKGIYSVRFPRLGCEIAINIVDLRLESEPRAAAIGYAMAHDVSNKNIVFIDCGGRDTSFAGIVKGQLLENKQYTSKDAGLALARAVANNLSEQYGIEEMDLEDIIEAIPSGFLQRGRDEYDLSMALESAKVDMAESLAGAVREYSDRVKRPLTTWTDVVCCGRTFGVTVNPKTSMTTSESLATFIEQNLLTNGLNAQFEVYARRNLICQGLTYLWLGEA